MSDENSTAWQDHRLPGAVRLSILGAALVLIATTRKAWRESRCELPGQISPEVAAKVSVPLFRMTQDAKRTSLLRVRRMRLRARRRAGRLCFA